eukprot:scaffold11644_cov20-Tisochrysis_lutea.AAC.3
MSTPSQIAALSVTGTCAGGATFSQVALLISDGSGLCQPKMNKLTSEYCYLIVVILLHLHYHIYLTAYYFTYLAAYHYLIVAAP